MSENTKYIGITIGPIFDTMSLSSSPVALWASSYIFSMLSKSICEELCQNGVAEKDIVSPYYQSSDELLNQNDGVGLFHDRIIFKVNSFDIGKLEEVKKNAVEKVAQGFGIESEFLMKYVMISSASFDAENPIMDSSHLLDCLELSKPFVYEEDENPIISLFEGNRFSRNRTLNSTPVIKNLSEFQLKIRGEENKFKSLEDIVRTGEGKKKYNYYAIVRSDGDRMSEIIKSLDANKIRDFSEQCFHYCSKIAKEVAAFGGVTVYSGGDDLLAILPCSTADSKTPFHFVKAANGIFDSVFESYNKPTSLSFGITVAHYKYPLYEALADSAELLFDIAKKDEKNRLAFRLQKHSGQSEGLIIPNSAIDDIIGLYDKVTAERVTDDEKDRVYLSALHKIAAFACTFNGASTQKEINNLFKNMFDGPEHKDNSFLHDSLPEFFGKLGDLKISAIDNEGVKSDDYSLILSYILRVLKFFVEKEGSDGN